MYRIVKYTDIYRICPKWSDIPKKKKCLSDKEVKNLLNYGKGEIGEIIFEEKVDGGIVGISREGYNIIIQGRGRIIPPTENSKQVFGLNSWAYANYEKIMKVPEKFFVYGEWMKASHNIFYDELPDFFIALDVWNGEYYLDYDNKTNFLKDIGFAQVSLLYRYSGIGSRLSVKDIVDMAKKSRFSSSETMEGIVIKNYKKRLMGKFVRREFDDAMDKHWLEKPIIENRLRSYKIKISI